MVMTGNDGVPLAKNSLRSAVFSSILRIDELSLSDLSELLICFSITAEAIGVKP
jgi:hypothetical protein